MQLRLQINLESDGSAKVGFIGNLAKSFLVEGSTNLVDWVPVGTCTANKEGDVEFKDPGAASHQFRFYRVVEQ